LDRFEVCAGHGENVCSLINKRSCQRLAAQTANVCAFRCADFYGVQAWWLTADRVHSCRCDFDVLPIAGQTAKKAFSDRAPTNIACADKKDVFHGSERAANAFIKLEANLSEVNFRWSKGVVSSVICGFSQRRIAVIVTTVPSLSSK
jgi:hypothetical protein